VKLSGAGVLQVEPTDHCNLRCRMCAPHHEGWPTVHGLPKGYLDPRLWERIVDGLVADDLSFDHIIFQWLGDPSLHPELPDLVGLAARRLAGRVGYLRVDSNGILLTPPRLRALLEGLPAEGPPLLLVFTLDAASPAVYAHVKGQDALDRVRRHIRALLQLRRALGARVNLQLQFVVQPGNAHEAGAFARYWLDLLRCQGDPTRWHDELLFKRLSVGGGTSGQAEADRLYERAIAEAGLRAGAQGPATIGLWEQRPWQQDDAHAGARGPCPGLWLTPVIRHDGALLLCCADLHSSMALGSLREQGFRALWEGPLATRKRLEHLEGRYTGACASCGGINWYTWEPAMGDAALARARDLGLVGPPGPGLG
jgi:Radical SAM superfamily/Iron-sulfur cluster-binding domain